MTSLTFTLSVLFMVLFTTYLAPKVQGSPMCAILLDPVCCQKPGSPVFNKENACLCRIAGGVIRSTGRCTPCQRVTCPTGYVCVPNKQPGEVTCVKTGEHCGCKQEVRVACCRRHNGGEHTVSNPCFCTSCEAGNAIVHFGHCT